MSVLVSHLSFSNPEPTEQIEAFVCNNVSWQQKTSVCKSFNNMKICWSQLQRHVQLSFQWQRKLITSAKLFKSNRHHSLT